MGTPTVVLCTEPFARKTHQSSETAPARGDSEGCLRLPSSGADVSGASSDDLAAGGAEVMWSTLSRLSVRVQQNTASLATSGLSCRRRRLRLSGVTCARYDVPSRLRPLLLTGGRSSRPVCAAAQPTPPSSENPARIADVGSCALHVAARIA